MRASFALLGTVAAAALGFWLGRNTDDQAPRQRVTAMALPGGSSSATSSETPSVGTSATLAEILRIPDDFQRSAALHVFASALDARGIEGVLDTVCEIEPHFERDNALAVLYARYAALDPRAAVDAVLRHRERTNLDGLYPVFQSWSRVDLASALARVEHLDAPGRLVAVDAILQARKDLPLEERRELALRFDMALNIPEPEIDWRSPQGAIDAWRAALALPARARNERLYEIVSEWARRDPRAAIRATSEIESAQQRGEMLEHAVSTWAEKSPLDAYDWAREQPRSRQRSNMIESCLVELARTDPDDATNLALGLPASERNSAVNRVVSAWAHIDPTAAAQWAASLESSAARQDAVLAVAEQYADRRLDEAIRWAKSLSSPEGPRVVTRIIGTVAMNDPARAATLLSLSEENQRDVTASNLAGRWAERDPLAALGWAAKYPASANARSSIYSAIFSRWSADDPTAALAQLSNMDGNDRTSASIALIGSRALDIETAEKLYHSVTDSDAAARRLAASRFYSRLRDQDPAAAERFRTETGILNTLGLETGRW